MLDYSGRKDGIFAQENLWDLIYKAPNPRSSHNYFVHVSQVDDVSRTWQNLRKNKKRQMSYVQEQERHVKEVDEFLFKHGRLCRRWKEEKADDRLLELDEIRKERIKASDCDKAKGIGLGIPYCSRQGSEVFRKMRTRVAYEFVHPLMLPVEWTKIKGDMIALMSKQNSMLLELDLKDLLLARLKLLERFVSAYYLESPRTPAKERMPRFADIAYLPQFRRIMEAPSASTGTDPLELAVVMFECSQCSSVLQYPSVLGHECNVAVFGPETEIYFKFVWDVSYSRTLPVEAFDAVDIRIASQIVRACGMDPGTATHAEMETLDLRFCCQMGPEFYAGARMVTRWRHALTLAHEGKIWRLASAEEEAQVKELERSRDEEAVEYHDLGEYWCCAYCDDMSYRLARRSVVRAHVRDSHGKPDPRAEAGDFYLHPEGDLQGQIPVILLAEDLNLEPIWDDSKDLFEER
ncbi:hypothetical protein POSPLADRAFT_1045631 [Postia placenta MAD-698-R-SB12]|uniref:Uncharacterized protein n=1 Tax=Postia placenta MAD-698-R-SB12 TaxID=670580 RepID=A0A1X6N3N8_9APHY|nr:hypothetical protein POSPLADRAFT_1045631 [Postia placenta MAD-698-R-SB12]OSX63251.1 hypothetical protein POSPLADRAFT_1045631 [Postia placenta MAD-698-R-SB12]